MTTPPTARWSSSWSDRCDCTYSRTRCRSTVLVAVHERAEVERARGRGVEVLGPGPCDRVDRIASSSPAGLLKPPRGPSAGPTHKDNQPHERACRAPRPPADVGRTTTLAGAPVSRAPAPRPSRGAPARPRARRGARAPRAAGGASVRIHRRHVGEQLGPVASRPPPPWIDNGPRPHRWTRSRN